MTTAVLICTDCAGGLAIEKKIDGDPSVSTAATMVASLFSQIISQVLAVPVQEVK